MGARAGIRATGSPLSAGGWPARTRGAPYISNIYMYSYIQCYSYK